MEKTRGVSLRLPAALFEQVELARGDVPRERWIRQVIERAVGAPPGARVARSSVEAKAGVGPIPKSKSKDES